MAWCQIYLFIAWGLLHALYFLPLLLTNRNRANLATVAHGRLFPTIREVLHMWLTFILVAFAWIFFRAENMQHAWHFITRMLSKSFLITPNFIDKKFAFFVLAIAAIFFIVEWLGRENHHALASLADKWKRPLRWCLYYILVAMIIIFGGKETQFIYFQF